MQSKLLLHRVWNLEVLKITNFNNNKFFGITVFKINGFPDELRFTTQFFAVYEKRGHMSDNARFNSMHKSVL